MIDIIRVPGTKRKKYQLTAFADGAHFSDGLCSLIDSAVDMSLNAMDGVELIDHSASGSHITVLIRTKKEPMLVLMQMLDDVTATVNAASAEYNNVSRDDLWTNALIAPAQIIEIKKNSKQGQPLRKELIK